MSKRDKKGKSIIALATSYCVIDLETTGLSPEMDDIIEVAAIKYENNIEKARFHSLVQPPFPSYGIDENGEEHSYYVSDFITELTGITNEMLADAPSTAEVITQFSDFVGDSLIVGHNVNFDINFLYDAYCEYLNTALSNNFVDSMRMARRLYPEMCHHRLKDIVAKYGLQNNQEHRAMGDAEATQKCYVLLCEEAIKQYGTEDAFIKSWNVSRHHSLKSSDIVGDSFKRDPDNSLYEKYCVFTGTLDKMLRKEAMQIVADLGGYNEDRITKNTNYLILGNNDYCSNIKDGKSNKQKKAEEYKLDGQDIEIIPEDVFYDMISETTESIEINESLDDNNDYWISIVKSIINNVIHSEDLPEKSLCLVENRSKEGNKVTSYSIAIKKPDFPKGINPNDNSKISLLNFQVKQGKKTDSVCLSVVMPSTLMRVVEEKYPDNYSLKIETGNDLRVGIDTGNPLFTDLLHDIIVFFITEYFNKSNGSFGCCNLFNECSDAKRCLHENRLYARSNCKYYRNLSEGRIFFGNNRNI